MATSLFFLSANPSATKDDMSGQTMIVPGSENATRTEPIQRQTRARRSSNKTQAPNKQRRRGLGVAELERLRIQDRWKKMTEMPQLQVSSTGQFFTAPTDFHIQTPFDLDASHQAPPYGLQGYCMTTTNAFQSTAKGFVVPVSSGYTTGGVVAGRVVGSPYGQLVGAPVALDEASRELTSMPNNVVQQQQCSILLDSCCSTCFKKKGISNEGSVAGTGLDRAKSAERRVRNSTRKKMIDSSNGCQGDFLELNLGSYNHGGSSAAQSLDACCEGTGGYGGIRTHSPVLDKEVEVMSVRRKVKKNNSSPSSIGVMNSSSTGLVLEYEFFPGKASRSSLLQELNNIPNYTTSSSSYASHSSSSSSIDLSLKLSYNNNEKY